MLKLEYSDTIKSEMCQGGGDEFYQVKSQIKDKIRSLQKKRKKSSKNEFFF